MPPRRVSLPGADELFRTTGGMALSPSLGRPAEAPRAETARPADQGAPEGGTTPAGAEAAQQQAAANIAFRGPALSTQVPRTAALRPSMTMAIEKMMPTSVREASKCFTSEVL